MPRKMKPKKKLKRAHSTRRRSVTERVGRRSSKQQTQQAVLQAFLSELRPEGPKGFEGLVARLLEAETGQRFRLASAGRQGGRDARSEQGAGNRVAVEAKRYGKTQLHLDAVRDKLTGATQAGSDLDVWVLATSGTVDDQIAGHLEEHANSRSVAPLILDVGTSGLSRLHCLMAKHAEHVIRFADSVGRCRGRAQLRSALQKVTKDNRCAEILDQIAHKLRGTLLGIDDARARTKRWLRRNLEDAGNSRAAFHQDTAIAASDVQRIPRPTIEAQLTAWYQNHAVAGGHAVLLGEEGTGKTWAVFSWIYGALQQAGGSLVLVLSATASYVRPDDTIETVMPRALMAQSGIGTEEFWKARLRRWLGHDAETTLRMLIIFDGLNERPGLEWRRFFAPLQDQDWRGKVAVLATDRTSHWEERCRFLETDGFRRIEIGGYDDRELAQALAGSPVRAAELPRELEPLIRKPRYCSLVIAHYEELRESTDFTVERLVYLDTRDRYIAKMEQPIRPHEFEQVIRGVASRYRSAVPDLMPADLRECLPLAEPGRHAAIYDEIATGGILVPGSRPGTHQLEPTRLIYGLGVLLTDHVRDLLAASGDVRALGQAIETWFEPHKEIDLKVKIAGSALFHSLLDPNYPGLGRRALLRYWLRSQNRQVVPQETFLGYVTRCPEDFLAVTDEFWSSGQDDGSAQEFLSRVYSRHRDHPRVKPLLMRAVTRWMGVVHPTGHRLLHHREGGEQRARTEIRDRVGRDLQPGETEVAGTALWVVGDHTQLTLPRLGLLIISAGERRDFVRALVPWAVAAAVMRYAEESEVVDWVVRLSDENLDRLLLPEIEALLRRGDSISTRAAQYLMRCLGTASALNLLKQHPESVSPAIQMLRDEHRADPCKSFLPWSEEECRRCQDREDVKLHWRIDRISEHVPNPNWPVSAGLTTEVRELLKTVSPSRIRSGSWATDDDHLLEKLTPILSSRAPSDLARFTRKVIKTLQEREDDALRLTGFLLEGVAPLLKRREVSALNGTLRAVREQSRTWSPVSGAELRDKGLFEAFGFLALLGHLDPDERLSKLLERPINALDLLRLRDWFEPLTRAGMAQAIRLLGSAIEPRTQTRLLWFLAYARRKVPQRHHDRLFQLAQSHDQGVRAAVLEYACQIRDRELGVRLVSLGRSYKDPNTEWETNAGIRLLVEFGQDLSLSDLAERVPFHAISWAVERRGCNLVDILALCELMDLAVAMTTGAPAPLHVVLPAVSIDRARRPLGIEPPNLVDDDRNQVVRSQKQLAELFETIANPKRVAAESAQRHRDRIQAIINAWKSDSLQWFGREFSHRVLAEIHRHRPDVVRRWVEMALLEGPGGRSARFRLGSLLVSLVPVLFANDPDLGLRLWRALRSGATMPLVIDAIDLAFHGPDGDASEAARIEALDASITDDDLSRIAFAANKHKRVQWLQGKIRELVTSPILWRRAKGLTLASTADITAEEFEKYVALAQVENTWVSERLPYLRIQVRENCYARYWYAQLLRESDRDVWWGAYQMFLRSADRRFWLWHGQLEGGRYSDRAFKERFFWGNQDALTKAMNRRRDREKSLFGLKIAQGAIHPFV